jgi:hypothetical protein
VRFRNDPGDLFLQHTTLDRPELGALLAGLAGMGAYLHASFDGLAPGEARRRATDGGFSPVEQVWHLADLEREGFGERIRRLLTATNPQLPDFDGARIAAQRGYQSRSLAEGLSAFERAREANLAALRAVPDEAWSRSGTQEGLGVVALGDMPRLMLEHDAAHRAEIGVWLQQRRAAGN